jgi:hypothetical protein
MGGGRIRWLVAKKQREERGLVTGVQELHLQNRELEIRG